MPKTVEGCAEDGRRLLLQACSRAFSTNIQPKVERLDQWP